MPETPETPIENIEISSLNEHIENKTDHRGNKTVGEELDRTQIVRHEFLPLPFLVDSQKNSKNITKGNLSLILLKLFHFYNN